ncbi:MAG: glycosyltransferase [Candidatus Bathyarchaeia archaeon]
MIGWHGSARGHFRNLAPIKPVLEELGKKCPFTLRLLGTEGSPFIHDYFRIPNVKTVFGPNEWIPYNQLPLYLQDTDIGISPLADNIWNRAKCAMKAIEYMSLGKPVVASNVGEHRYVIRKGINGFLTENAEDWVSTLENLAMNSDIRRRVGEAARETAVEYYSLKKIAHLVSGLLEEIT